MVCMQLYAKEIECPPGASSAASILSRNLQTHGLDSKRSSEVKVLVFCIHCLIVNVFWLACQPVVLIFSVPDLLVICIAGSCLEILCMEGLNGRSTQLFPLEWPPLPCAKQIFFISC